MIKNFAVQLYSIRHEIDRLGWTAVLEKLSAIGYTGVELAGYGGYSAEEMKALLDKNGLRPVGAHIAIERLETALSEEMAYHKTLGTTFIIVPIAPFGSSEEVRRTSERLAALARKVRGEGFRFAFHNHDAEFEREGEGYRLEAMMALAAEVEIELDVYWASRMNCDCAAFIKKHHSRICALHIKQMDASGESVDLHEGVLDFKELIQTGLDNGITDFIHEQEAFSADPFDSLEKGFNHIMNL
jgi:sugar phosphate isomerase/epimerase